MEKNKNFFSGSAKKGQVMDADRKSREISKVR